MELNDGTELDVDSPAKLVDAAERQSVSEPYVALEMFAPTEYTGTLMELAQSRRGEYVDQKFLSQSRVSIKYNMPLAEVCTPLPTHSPPHTLPSPHTPLPTHSPPHTLTSP